MSTSDAILIFVLVTVWGAGNILHTAAQFSRLEKQIKNLLPSQQSGESK